jgi:hypothetical protein
LSNLYGMPFAVDLSTFFASTETPLFVPEAQHCLHIQVGTTDFSLFLITSYCTKLEYLVNYRALHVRIPIYYLIYQSISLLHSLHSCMTHCSTKIQVSKDLPFFFASHPLLHLHDDVKSSPTMLVLSHFLDTCCVSSKKNLHE